MKHHLGSCCQIRLPALRTKSASTALTVNSFSRTDRPSVGTPRKKIGRNITRADGNQKWVLYLE
jgi:hypothetical protein